MSIVSLWCRKVELTEEQKTKLNSRKIRIQHLRRLAKQSHFFLAGLALYWAEGFKSVKEGRLGFWSKTTKIPLTQFEKPFYHRSTWLREYSNRDTYFGVLRIRVRKSSELLNKMHGWIDGLSNSVI